MSSLGGPSGSSGPTAQQQALMDQQALTTANLNLEENDQRKTMLSMMGTRTFRGSALSRALRGNAPGSGNDPAPPASRSQINTYGQIIGPVTPSLLDQQGSGSTPAGGTGGSGGGGRAVGGRGGPMGGGGGKR